MTPWLGRPIVRLTWRQLAKGAILRFSCDMLSFARPLLMQQILLICEGSPAVVSRDNAWMLAVTMAVVSIFAGLALGLVPGPWSDKTLSPDRRARLLVANMTLEER